MTKIMEKLYGKTVYKTDKREYSHLFYGEKKEVFMGYVSGKTWDEKEQKYI